MLDPIKNAVEVWLSFSNNLPLPIIALMDLSFYIFCILFLIHIVYKIRS